MTKAISPATLYFRPDGKIPNSPLPVLVYYGVLEGISAAAFEKRLSAHQWGGAWRNGIYDFHHFHSNAHETLGIMRGRVRAKIGGAKGRVLELAAGDMLVLPAGTGHKSLGHSHDLLVVGAYPLGQENYDICRDSHKADIKKNLASVPRPACDPLYGRRGPLLKLWG